MSSFWSLWVAVLIVVNLGLTLFLFIWSQRVDIPVQDDGTTGHVWAHGILKEAVRKLPLWWALLSTLVLVCVLIYFILYPGFGAAKGYLGWTSSGEHDSAVAANDAQLGQLKVSLSGKSPQELAANAAATRIGERLFVDNCAACHGREAQGNQLVGAPNLIDAEWLWGGDDAAITTSILDGRHGAMPPFGAAFDRVMVRNIANYVSSLSGHTADEKGAAIGQAQFAVCTACHGPDGKGNPSLGAPNLTDDTWLYGSETKDIEQTIREGRNGVMPAWKSRLGPDEVGAIIAWLRSRAPPTTVAATQ